MRLTKTQQTGLKIKASRASLRFTFLFVLAAAFAAAQCTNNNLYDALANPGGGQGSNGAYQEMLPVFVSSVLTTGDFGNSNFSTSTPWSNACNGQSGLAMADCACNQMAQAANLPALTYVAWVSTQGDDMTCRIQNQSSSNCALPPGGPTWVDTLGNIIAQGYAELFSGTLRNPIGYNENKTSVSSNVWTGTAQTGLAAGDHCFGWSDATSGKSGNQGAALFSDYQWTEGANTPDCTGSFPIYCFGIE